MTARTLLLPALLLFASPAAAKLVEPTPTVKRCNPPRGCPNGQECRGNICVKLARPKQPIKPQETKPAPTK